MSSTPHSQIDSRLEPIDNAVLTAIELRELIFEMGDEPLIRTMDLLIYALGRVATRHRLESMLIHNACASLKRSMSAA